MAVLLLAAVPLIGCPDPDGAKDEFVERTEEFRQVKDAAVAQGFFDASGRYFLSLGAVFDPSKPVLFDAAVVIDTDAKTISMTMQPLSVMERMPVGDALTTDPVAIGDDGKFEIDFGEVLVDGAADPLIPGAAIRATMVFTGQTNAEDEVCGQVNGMVIEPAMLSLEGSTFGTVPAEDGMFADLETRIGCSEE